MKKIKNKMGTINGKFNQKMTQTYSSLKSMFKAIIIIHSDDKHKVFV